MVVSSSSSVCQKSMTTVADVASLTLDSCKQLVGVCYRHTVAQWSTHTCLWPKIVRNEADEKSSTDVTKQAKSLETLLPSTLSRFVAGQESHIS